MTYSLVAVVTNAIRDGRRVVGYGFNSNGRYGQGGLVRKRFAPRVLEAGPASLLDESGSNPDSDGIWATRGSLRGRATLRIANGSQAIFGLSPEAEALSKNLDLIKLKRDDFIVRS
jgi:hypothetical protein